MLPGIDGNEVLRRIRRQSSVPIIMLTAKGGDVDRVVGLEMGADDYVPKPYFPRELVARLRAVLRRQSDTQTTPRDCLAMGALELSSGKREVLWGGAPFDLTTSEFDLLEQLMRGGDLVSTKEDLSLKVLGRPRESYDRSIDVHVSNLRRKLAACSSGAHRDRNYSWRRLPAEGADMKRRLFWKILLAFWLTFFLIVQGIWLMFMRPAFRTVGLCPEHGEDVRDAAASAAIRTGGEPGYHAEVAGWLRRTEEPD